MSNTSLPATFGEQMLAIADQYVRQGGTIPLELDELARFAIEKDLWKSHGNTELRLCKQAFARAFREQYHTDKQGRQVRTFHATKKSEGERQQVFWADMRDPQTPHEHMELAFHQRRNQIVGDCVQLSRDIDSYNDNSVHGATIQKQFDFTDDIAEREQPSTYRPNQPR